MMEPEDLRSLTEAETNTVRDNVAQESYLEAIKTPDWLENAEHPFRWMKSLEYKMIVKSIHCRLSRKIPDYNNQGPDYGFEKFSVFLVRLCMKQTKEKLDENSSGGDNVKDVDEDRYSDSSVEEEVDADDTYRKLAEVVEEMRSREGDVMYTRIGAALEHVLTATRANMLHLEGRDEESMQMARTLRAVETSEHKAGIEAIKAKFLLFMYNNLTVPLNASRLAAELDPEFAYWKYLTGKIIRRERRFYKQYIKWEEFNCFKSAVDMERNPKFLVYLAQANQEMAMKLKCNKYKSEEPEEMLKESVKLFRECWELKNDSAPIARRVGNGMMKMKAPHSNFQLAEEALLKAAELSPNHITYHALGNFYLEYGHDEEKALSCFSKFRGSFGMAEMIRYKIIKDPTSDVSEQIKSSIATRAIRSWIRLQDILYCNIGWYYLAIQRDIIKATEFFWKILEKDSNSFRMLKFESYAFGVQRHASGVQRHASGVERPVNMLRVLVGEVKITMEANCSKPNGTRDNQVLNNFLEKIFEKHPDLREMTPDHDMLPKIKREAEAYFNHLRNQRYGKTYYQSTAGYNKANRQGKDNFRSGNVAQNGHFKGVENWRSENKEVIRDEERNGGNNNQNSWSRSWNNSRDLPRHIDQYDRRRRDSGHEEGNNRRAYNQNRGRNFSGNRYDTTENTNWRKENRQ